MKRRVSVAGIIFFALVLLADVLLFPVLVRLMAVPFLRAHTGEVIAIVVGAFATTVGVASAFVDRTRPSDDTVMVPVLFATGASFTGALLVCMQMWKREHELGLSYPPALTVFVFAAIMIPSVSLAFWWGARRYRRLRG